MEKTSKSDANNTDKNISLTKLDIGFSIALKASLLLGVVSLINVGHESYNQYAHNGPNCLKQQSSFQYWLGENDKEKKGRIVSIHNAKLQPVNGTTKCYGTFLTDSGSYKKWSGSITELSNKKIIGQARLGSY